MSSTARVENPVTHQNVQDAFDLLMEVRVVGQLMQGLAESSHQIENHRWCDLGNLICRLTDHPSSVLGELESGFDGGAS